MPHEQTLSAARQPLLEDNGYYSCDDGFGDGIVPPDPFASTREANLLSGSDQEDQGDDIEQELPSHCIEKLGLCLGIIIGMIVQLSTLGGSLVGVTVWGTEDGPYATITFAIWCCLMSSMFFVAFGLLRFLVQMSLRMVYRMERDQSNQRAMVVDAPTDSPTPNLSLLPAVWLEASSESTKTIDSKNERQLLEDVMWHMKLHYVLGVNLGIGLSWLVTNLAFSDRRVSLIFSLVPPLLGFAWFRWMKQSSRDSLEDDESERFGPSNMGTHV